MLDPGKYRARAVAASPGESKNGTEYVAVQFQLLDVDTTLTWYGYLSERAIERTAEALRTCGFLGDDPFALEAGNLLGLDSNEVEVVVEAEADLTGTMRSRIRWVNALRGTGLAVTPIAEDKRKAVRARFKAAILQVAGAAKPAPTRRATRQAANDFEDAPPF